MQLKFRKWDYLENLLKFYIEISWMCEENLLEKYVSNVLGIRYIFARCVYICVYFVNKT